MHLIFRSSLPIYSIRQLVQTHEDVQGGYLACDYNLLQAFHLRLPVLLHTLRSTL